MKRITFITVLMAMMMAVTPAFAQEENGFKKFNVREDFTENGFQWFHDAELLAVGNKEKCCHLYCCEEIGFYKKQFVFLESLVAFMERFKSIMETCNFFICIFNYVQLSEQAEKSA